MKKFAGLFVSLLAGSAFANGMAQTHDGFFLNLGIGVGAGTQEWKSSENWKYEGTAGFFNLRLGGCPIPNLAIHADLQGVSLGDLTEKAGDESRSLDNDVKYGVSSLGVGATYYVDDLIFLGASVIPFGSLTFDNGEDNETADGDMMGFNFRLGKEWWVSENWGLGVELQYQHTTVSDVEDTNIDVTTDAYGILFSATFN